MSDTHSNGFRIWLRAADLVGGAESPVWKSLVARVNELCPTDHVDIDDPEVVIAVYIAIHSLE